MKDKLKENNWYFIRNGNGIYAVGLYKRHKHSFLLYDAIIENIKELECDDGVEWIMIDPPLLFNSLKSEQDKSYSEIKDKK